MALPVVTSRPYYGPETTLIQLESLKMLLQVASSAYPSNIPYSNDHLLDSYALLVKLLTRHLQDHPSFITTLPNHLEPDKRATTAAATHMESTNKLLLSTASITLPRILPPELNTEPSPKYTYTASTSPIDHPSQIISPLFAPSNHPS